MSSYKEKLSSICLHMVFFRGIHVLTEDVS